MHKELETDFINFREECIETTVLRNSQKALFESEPATEQLLRRVADGFFGDLSHWMVELLFVRVSRLTDPAESRDKPNLTCQYLVRELQNVHLSNPTIEDLNLHLMSYRELIKEARNKRLGHLDLFESRNTHPLGEHSEQQANDFFVVLNKFTDEVGRALGVGPLDYRSCSGPGDVVDFLRYLREHTNEDY